MAGDKHGAEETQEQEAAQEHGNEQATQDQQEVTAGNSAAGADYEKAIAERDARIAELEGQVADAAKNAETAEALRGEIAELKAQGEEERGTVTATVLVVREDAAEAGAVALGCERAVRGADWESYADAGIFRIVGIDTTVPAFLEEDGSGRAVWKFEVVCTVVREL